ncbi:DUF58 domain-containing protein [Microlunatus sp. Y2014]|uniref:DUF58 domain-containing protein n=1 Tax=Microlunatus sp. Y2014 TaxID=3418488 RepID=UPI003DA78604
MRHTFRALTLRGRTLLVAGLLITVVCALIGERDILAFGLILFFVPLVTVVVLSRSRLRLTCDRRVSPNEVELGSRMTGELTLLHKGRIPVGVVLLEDQVPVELGPRPRFLVDEASQHWERTIRYPLTGQFRGQFHTGPLRVRLSDAFGLAHLDRAFQATSELLVTPKVHVLDALPSAGGGGQTGDDRPHRIGVVGQDDVLVREYHQGDDVRRIHWRSTAKRGEMMVRREEQAWDPSMTILLDNRSSAHAGDTRHGSFEWAVSAAASIGAHFISDGFTIEIYHGQGRLDLAHLSAQRDTVRHVMLRGLAELTTRPQASLAHGIAEMQTEAMGQVVIAILGKLTPAEAYAVARTRRNRAQGVALLLEVDSFAGARRAEQNGQNGQNGQQDQQGQNGVGPDASELDQVEAVFISEQWRVVRVDAAQSVPEVWDRIGLLQAVRG